MRCLNHDFVATVKMSYEILYTRDLHKKLKSWLDGTMQLVNEMYHVRDAVDGKLVAKFKHPNQPFVEGQEHKLPSVLLQIVTCPAEA